MMGGIFAGHHWRSGQGEWAVKNEDPDHPLNGRAASAANWAWWYSPVDDLEELMTGWAEAWLEDSRKEANGKPAWIIPGPIGFRTDTVGGNNATEWRKGSPNGDPIMNVPGSMRMHFSGTPPRSMTSCFPSGDTWMAAASIGSFGTPRMSATVRRVGAGWLAGTPARNL